MQEEQKASVDETSAEARSAQRKGADVMRDAADKALRDNSTGIANGLVQSAKEGHMMAARLLYMIANDQVRMTAAEVKKARSLAAEWAAEREWLGNMQKPLAQAPDSSPEPESEPSPPQ
ncbi:MAG TPA: hypothetical protein VG893_07690 [Terracidiphilus sp.]|nr:hypothetical protein [Terracidiphilus sp.]